MGLSVFHLNGQDLGRTYAGASKSTVGMFSSGSLHVQTNCF